MSLSVRVERVNHLPDGQQAAVEFRKDGTVIFYLHSDHITATGAEALQTFMTCARVAYHQDWHLPTTSLTS